MSVPRLTVFERARRAVAALPNEDLPLLLGPVLDRVDCGDWPADFQGRSLDECERFMLHFWLWFSPTERADMLWALLERAVDERVAPAALRQMAAWIDGCLP